MKLALIGFGEAGQAFAQGFKLPAGRVKSYDLKFDQLNDNADLLSAANALNVDPCRWAELCVREAELVFALVPTDQTIAAAQAAAPHLAAKVLWLDGSSSSPGRKREAAAIINGAGGRYVDMAIMAPVHPLLHKTPVLLSGPDASDAQAIAVTELGMVAELAGEAIGEASAVKMIRSVLVKGIEAVTAECMLAARRAGVEDRVIASFVRSDANVDWAARTAYNLERMTHHGMRRAAEMREVVTTLDELGIPSRVSAATVAWQDQLGSLGDASSETALLDQLDAILDRIQ